MTRHSSFFAHHSSLILLSLLLLTATACHRDQRPADVLAADTMVNVLTDLYLIEGYYAVESQYRFDTASPEVIGAVDEVLKTHHVTRESMEKSFDYYSQHPDEYEAIQKEVATRIEQLTAPGEAYSR